MNDQQHAAAAAKSKQTLKVGDTRWPISIKFISTKTATCAAAAANYDDE